MPPCPGAAATAAIKSWPKLCLRVSDDKPPQTTEDEEASGESACRWDHAPFFQFVEQWEKLVKGPQRFQFHSSIVLFQSHFQVSAYVDKF